MADVLALLIVALMVLAGLGAWSLIGRAKRRVFRDDIQMPDPQDADETPDHREDPR